MKWGILWWPLQQIYIDVRLGSTFSFTFTTELSDRQHNAFSPSAHSRPCVSLQWHTISNKRQQGQCIHPRKPRCSAHAVSSTTVYLFIPLLVISLWDATWNTTMKPYVSLRAENSLVSRATGRFSCKSLVLGVCLRSTAHQHLQLSTTCCSLHLVTSSAGHIAPWQMAVGSMNRKVYGIRPLWSHITCCPGTFRRSWRKPREKSLYNVFKLVFKLETSQIQGINSNPSALTEIYLLLLQYTAQQNV
jgi:hypothetical protein